MKQLSAIQSQPGVCMNMEKRDRRAAETERIIFHTKLKTKKKNLKILTACPVSWYFISCEKQELKFTESKITEKQGFNLTK